MKYLALVASCLLAVTLASPAVADDPATPTFTWPTVTSFNPDAYTYEVTVSGDDDYRYRLMSGGESFDVTGPGTYAIDLGWYATDRVRAYRCDDVRCTELVAESPELTLVRRLSVSWESDDRSFAAPPGGSRVLRYTLGPFVPGTTLGWFLVPAGGDPSAALATGEVSEPAARGAVTIPLPADARHQEKYDVLLRAELDTELYGHLADDADPARAAIDSQAPTVRLELVADTIYPVADLGDWNDKDYPARLEFEAFSDEPATGTLTFTRADGIVVEHHSVSVDRHGNYEVWTGRRRGAYYPEGSYEIRLDVVDDAGNPASTSATVYLSHAKQRSHRVTKILPAARTLVDRSVGSCSTLTIPSSRGWKGSIGYAAQSRCDRAADSNITTVHRLYLPKSFGNSYELRIYFYGVAGASKPGSAIASGWINRKGKIEETHLARGPKARWNILPQGDWSPDVFKDRNGRPYVLWALGTAGENRYDVKSFKYKLRYTTFS